jgi:nucleoporin GLE1
VLVEQLQSPPSPSAPTVLDENTPRPYAYLLSHLSKAIIKQAESEVSAKVEAAFPLARVIVGLLIRGHGALGEVLFARLVKKCPWVVPYYPSKQPVSPSVRPKQSFADEQDQSREAYEKSTGRGSDESKADYISRMGGIATLYFAILQTPLASLVRGLPATPTPKELPNLIHSSLRPIASWAWLANSLRDPMPAMEPIAHLVSSWIETTGYDTVKRYGDKQSGKILDALYREGIQAGKMKGDGQAAVQRLDLLLVNWKQDGLTKPNGRDWE